MTSMESNWDRWPVLKSQPDPYPSAGRVRARTNDTEQKMGSMVLDGESSKSMSVLAFVAFYFGQRLAQCERFIPSADVQVHESFVHGVSVLGGERSSFDEKGSASECGQQVMFVCGSMWRSDLPCLLWKDELHGGQLYIEMISEDMVISNMFKHDWLAVKVQLTQVHHAL